MDAPMRRIRLSSGHVLAVWDNETTAPHGQAQLRYAMLAPDESVLFCGADYGVSPMHSIDSDAALLGLLAFLTLRPGDTDSEYFAEYTPAQMDFCESFQCESLSCEVSIAEESRAPCVCAMWTNLDKWECEDAGNVAAYEVRDLGEDGSQYFPGVATYGSKFPHVAVGMGDTLTEALDDALETMAQADAQLSEFQVFLMRADYSGNLSAHEGLHSKEELEDENFNHDGCDWNRYVAIRYTLKGE